MEKENNNFCTKNQQDPPNSPESKKNTDGENPIINDCTKNVQIRFKDYKRALYFFPSSNDVSKFKDCVLFQKKESTDQSLKEIRYPVNSDDCTATVLIKDLINLIFIYENEIVDYIQKIGMEQEFNIKKYENEFHYFDGDIGKRNIAKLLGISYSNFKRNWAQPLEKGENINFYFKSFFKLFHSTNKYFPPNVKLLADDIISRYLDSIDRGNDLRVKLSLIFNNYVNTPLGFTDISYLLGKSNTYLNILSENLKTDLEFEQINKYFNLLSKIFLLKYIDFTKNNIELDINKNLEELKQNCYYLIINIMVENKILDINSFGEFDVIFYSYLTLAEIKRKFFNINDFSRLITDNPKGILFSTKLRDGWRISIEQCNLIKKIIPSNSRYFKKAISLIDNYIEYRESLRKSEYHIYWHDEDIIKIHCTILAIRELCIDILNLDSIIPESFIKNFPPEWYSFNRHHIYQADKKSIDPNRLILTIAKNHPTHEGKINLIRKLLNWRFNGKNEIPSDYQKIPQRKNRWLEYLKRRDYIIKFGVGMFVIKFLTVDTGKNYFIERFYPNILKNNTINLNTLTQQKKLQIGQDLEDEIKTILNKWIDKYPKLIPKLPAYAKHLLPLQMRIYKYFN